MKNPFRSLPARIVAFVFGLVVLTSLTVMGLSINSIDGFLREEINQRYPVLLTAKAEGLTEWYDQRERELGVFSQSDVLVGNVPKLSRGSERRQRRANEEMLQYMRYVLDGFRHYTALMVLDPGGDVLLQVGAPVDLAEAHRASLAKVRTTSIGGVMRQPTGDVQIVSAPLGGPPLDPASPPGEEATSQPAPVGSLHAVFDVGSLEPVLTVDDVGVGGQILVVGRNRNVLASSGGQKLEAPYAGPLPSDRERVIVSDYERDYGERLVGGALAFDRFGWTLVVEQPYDHAFEPVVGAIRDVLLLNLGILLVVGLATYAIAKSIIRPIEALSRAARRISDGERDVAIPEAQSRDEVGVLTRAFSAMTMRLTQNATVLQERNEELHRVNEVLEQLSITDGLTKLHNHRHFQEALLHECKRTERSGRDLCLILIDIDRFKYWNDRLGHAGGDEILRRMAEVLTEMVRETDTLARYGGEEFALIAPNTDLEGARMLAEKIRGTVAETTFLIEPPSEREPVTVSIGVAPYDGDRVRMFGEADRALYLAKESGRDCVMTSEDLG